MFDKITWLGHSGILIESGLNVYFDPYNVPDDLPKAHIVFLTHPHYDHLSPDDIAKISTEDTMVVATADSLAKLAVQRAVVMAPGDLKVCNGVKVQAKAAYNHKRPYHPKSKGWVGFFVDLGGFRVYHAGDTDAEGEMADLEPDVAFLPIDNLYGWDASSAASALAALRPKRALPIHFGTICGSRSDAAKFLGECEKRGLPGEFYRNERTGTPHQVIPATLPARAAS